MVDPIKIYRVSDEGEVDTGITSVGGKIKFAKLNSDSYDLNYDLMIDKPCSSPFTSIYNLGQYYDYLSDKNGEINNKKREIQDNLKEELIYYHKSYFNDNNKDSSKIMSKIIDDLKQKSEYYSPLLKKIENLNPPYMVSGNNQEKNFKICSAILEVFVQKELDLKLEINMGLNIDVHFITNNERLRKEFKSKFPIVLDGELTFRYGEDNYYLHSPKSFFDELLLEHNYSVWDK